MIKLSHLTAISPIDGRYGTQMHLLRTIFSEYSLLKFRVQIEIRWLQKLASCIDIKEIPPFEKNVNHYLDAIIINFNLKDAKQIKVIESTINHDVKAVEYFLKEKISVLPVLKKIREFIHFGCTSEDINNLSYALMLISARNKILLPTWQKILSAIKKLATKYHDIPLLSRTHGQPASPSTFGKEMANFFYRLSRQYNQLKQIQILGKMNGAVGNYNAHIAAYPKINWHLLSKDFVTSLGINWNPYTTQIEPHDYIAELFDCISRFNTILIDFNRDMWGYIALNYLKQDSTTKDIGSSTMPHKINPVNFENSEGNLGLANAIMNHLTAKLPISRWQRDLSDSTVLRNIGVSIGYALIAYFSVLKGLNKIKINKQILLTELNQNWAILAEPIQTIMRRYGIEKSYEKLRKLTYGKHVDMLTVQKFIDSLPLPISEKIRLSKITPANYIGRAIKMVDDLNK